MKLGNQESFFDAKVHYVTFSGENGDIPGAWRGVPCGVIEDGRFRRDQVFLNSLVEITYRAADIRATADIALNLVDNVP